MMKALSITWFALLAFFCGSSVGTRWACDDENYTLKGEKCYIWRKQLKNQEGALSDCRSHNGDLAPAVYEDQKFLASLVTVTQEEASASLVTASGDWRSWVQGKHVDDCIFFTGNTVTKKYHTSWNPCYNSYTYFCVADAFEVDSRCPEDKFGMTWLSKGNWCFLYSGQKKKLIWSEANNFCKNDVGAALPDANTAEDVKLMAGFMKFGYGGWVGGQCTTTRCNYIVSSTEKKEKWLKNKPQSFLCVVKLE